MLRLRRSISALAPDISLGVVAVYCNILAPRLPPPVMDVDKVCPSPSAVYPSTVASHACPRMFGTALRATQL